MPSRIAIAVVVFGSIGLAASPLNAQQKNASEKKVERRASVISEEQEVGRTFRISPDELAPPKATKAVSNGPLTLPFNGQAPKVPEGFTVTLFAKLEHPRRLLVLPNGDIIVLSRSPAI
jgi:hypothetical protein